MVYTCDYVCVYIGFYVFKWNIITEHDPTISTSNEIWRIFDRVSASV